MLNFAIAGTTRIERDHANRLKDNLNSKKKFRSIKDEIKGKNNTPTRILEGGKDVRSQKELATLFNEYFISKVSSIRKDFDDQQDKALRITKALTSKTDRTFKFTPVTVYKVYKTISKTKHQTHMEMTI